MISGMVTYNITEIKVFVFKPILMKLGDVAHVIGRCASAKKKNMKRHLSGVIWDPFRLHLVHIRK